MISTTADQSPGRLFLAILRGSLVASLVLGLLCTAVLFVIRGPAGGLSAAIGVVVALAFLASGVGLMARLVKDSNPLLFMAIALSVYLAQVIALLAFIIGMDRVSWLDGRALAIAVLVTVVGWQFLQMRALRRARTRVYDEAPPSGSGTRS